jgi:hypothetical protein
MHPETLETDGQWCPMSHCNRTDNSFQSVLPLRSVKSFRKISAPVAHSEGFIHLGSFTGRNIAVCTYSTPGLPALAAFRYQDGSVLWTSPMEDLPGYPLRVPVGILMARMSVKGKPAQNYVFAANVAEFVAYSEEGQRIWKRRNAEVAPEAPWGVGLPISMTFNDAKEIVVATTGGWVVKLSPLNGQTIDAYKMETSIVHEGCLYPGYFFTCKSPIIIGNTLYLLAEFKAYDSKALPRVFSPVHVIRISLTSPGVLGGEHRIQALHQPSKGKDRLPDRALVGIYRGRGSPPAWTTRAGTVQIFATAHAFRNGRMYPTIAGIEDEKGALQQRWLSVLNVARGDSVHAAPALHGPSGILFVTTLQNIFLFRRFGELRGTVPCPPALPGDALVSIASNPAIARVGFGSPFALTLDQAANEIVGYTNFRAISKAGLSYGVLGAFALHRARDEAPRPLWYRPLGVSSDGRIVPGLGTLGQPALFEYDHGNHRATGLIVNTVSTGTYMMK